MEVFTMTKFENIGVAHQYESRNIKEANKEFERSCNFCCNNGMHIECKCCCIAFAHDVMENYFFVQEQKRM